TFRPQLRRASSMASASRRVSWSEDLLRLHILLLRNSATIVFLYGRRGRCIDTSGGCRVCMKPGLRHLSEFSDTICDSLYICHFSGNIEQM
ncbi:hypothetical protein L9F63_000434, partial [Diploptera punctata]